MPVTLVQPLFGGEHEHVVITDGEFGELPKHVLPPRLLTVAEVPGHLPKRLEKVHENRQVIVAVGRQPRLGRVVVNLGRTRQRQRQCAVRARFEPSLKTRRALPEIRVSPLGEERVVP